MRHLPNTFDKVSRYRRGKYDKPLLVCWHKIMKDLGSDKHPQPFARPAKQTVFMSPVRISWTRVRVNPRSLFISNGLVQHKRRLYTLYITIYMAKAAAKRLFLSRRILKYLTKIKSNNIGIDTNKYVLLG